MTREEHLKYLASITDFWAIVSVDKQCINKHFLGDVILVPECHCKMISNKDAEHTIFQIQEDRGMYEGFKTRRKQIS